MIATEQLPSSGAVLARATAENFPVALGAVGPRARRHLIAIYGYARLVDDLGDEAEGDRLALLDRIDDEVDAIYEGAVPEHPLLARLAETVRECGLPRDPLRRLVQANRQDQRVTRYESFEELLDYSQLSAAPVGELVLHVFGRASRERVALSDRVCAGLQVVEHLQDVREDHARGRVYLPQADLRELACSESELAALSAGPALRAVIAREAQRAHDLLDAGAPLARRLPLRPRLAVAGFVAGGRAALRVIERAGFDVCATPPGRDRGTFARSFAATVTGR